MLMVGNVALTTYASIVWISKIFAPCSKWFSRVLVVLKQLPTLIFISVFANKTRYLQDLKLLVSDSSLCGFSSHQMLAEVHGITNRTQVATKHIVFSLQLRQIAQLFNFERMISWYNIIGIQLIRKGCNNLNK